MRGKRLFVRDQTGDILLVNSCNHGPAAEITLTLFAHGCQDVAGECASALDAAGGCFLEALGGAAVCFNLWHEILLLRYKNVTCTGTVFVIFLVLVLRSYTYFALQPGADFQ